MSSMHRAFRKFAILLAFSPFLTLGVAKLALADTMAVGPEQISCMGVNVGTLSMTAPVATASGLTVGGTFTGNANLNPNDIVMWVQLITTTKPFRGQPASPAYYFDPAPTDPLNTNYPAAPALQYPFYYNVIQTANANQNTYYYKNYQPNGNSTARFTDSPSRPRNGPAVWDAELDLVCWNPVTDTLGLLWSGTYGFTTNATNMTTDVRGIGQNGTVADGVYSNPTPTAFNQTALDAFNKNSAANNWTITSSCDCVVPEPGIACSMLGCSGVFAVFALGRTRRGFSVHAASLLAA